MKKGAFMKWNQLIRKISCLLALCIFFITPKYLVSADTTSELQVSISDYSKVIDSLDGQLDGHKLQVWKLSDTNAYENRSTLIRKLHSLSEDELNSIYTSEQFDMEFTNEFIRVKGIPDGDYYVRTIVKNDKLVYDSEFIFRINNKQPSTVKIVAKKVVEQDTLVKLNKVDQDGNPLQGVGFQLFQKDSAGNLLPVATVGSEGVYSFLKIVDSVFENLYTDKSGQILVQNLPVGQYIFREVEALAGYTIQTKDTAFEVTSHQTTQVTVVNKKQPVGRQRFVKIDSKSKNQLAGASFKIMQRTGNQYTPVIVDGKELVVTSDSEGVFDSGDLPYGTYYIWEVQAPKGFVQLSAPISFDITGDDTEENVVKVIENKPTPPIEVPNTGDIRFYLLMIVSVLLVVGGFYVQRNTIR